METVQERKEGRSGVEGSFQGRGKDVVFRPPLKGISAPIPSVPVRDRRDDLDQDAELSKQIVELVAKRKKLRQDMQSAGSGRSADPSPQAGPTSKRVLPKVIADVQLVPPRPTSEAGRDVQRKHPRDSHADSDWQTVEAKETKKKRGKKEKKTVMANKIGTSGSKPEARKGQLGQKKPIQEKRRPPRTAAVAIKGVGDNFCYAEALKNLRSKIALPDLNIRTSHVRKAVSGGIVIEISGEEKTKKAELLKEKIAEVLGPTARVSRPVIKGELRLIGLDDSVIAEEVADVVALAGGCNSEEVKVGTIRPMTNGLYSVWAQCPLGAAIKAAQPGKIRIGWTIAKIELLKARTVQCYRCWGRGHLRAHSADTDRSNACYRCGEEGHPAITCRNPICCALCKGEGKDPHHRVGSATCHADVFVD